MTTRSIYPPGYTSWPPINYAEAARQGFTEATRLPCVEEEAQDAAQALDDAVRALVTDGMDYPPVPNVYFVPAPHSDTTLPPPANSRWQALRAWLCCGQRK
ncbi:MAG: hypothetical protein EOO40_00250 [Deltaproteobacteria bacterium]|nr:MAG: hypothetical protein EOO40_00250 [Deltaproteobacteria bacterium]